MAMHPIESALYSAISKHSHMPLVIAYSGGVDSQVLLHAIALLSHKKHILNSITVCHVNHGLSKNANTWQLFAQQTCLELEIPLKICQVNVKAKPQQSLEALARDARYHALQSINTTSSLILTGHHSDDQAETFLLALKRGSGLKGLSAMANESKLGKDLLVRPLLTITRSQILDYAQKQQLSWIEDESNLDTCFDRNFIRNDVMPLLSARWPSIVNTINRSSEHCKEGQLLLDELAAEDLSLCQHDCNSLSVEPLNQLSQARFNNLIRFFLSQHHCLMPSTEQLIQLRLQLNAADDKSPEVKVGDNFFRRFKGALYLTAQFEDINHWQAELDLANKESCIELPDHLGKLHLTKVALNELTNESQVIVLPDEIRKVTIRFSHNNPTCLPEYRNRSRSLKKILQELNIPPWLRKRVPFLFYGDELVAAIGYFVCQRFLPQEPLQTLPSTARDRIVIKVESCNNNW